MKRMLTTIGDSLTAFLLGAVAALALVWGIDTDPDLSTTPEREQACHMACDSQPPYGGPDEAEQGGVIPAPAEGEAGITDDSPGFNCLTMGNRVCGPGWERVPDDVYASIYNGNLPTDTDYCVWSTGALVTIACTDGMVTTS